MTKIAGVGVTEKVTPGVAQGLVIAPSVLALIGSLFNHYWFLVALFLFLIIWAVRVLPPKKKELTLILRTSSGEVEALKSEDEGLVLQTKQAIETAPEAQHAGRG
jgi:hypothetical protein